MDNLQRLTDEIMESLIQGHSVSHHAYRKTIASQQVIIDELERETWLLKQELLQALQRLRKLSMPPVDWGKHNKESQSEPVQVEEA